MINITDDFFSIVIGEGDDKTDIGLMFDGVTNIERDIGNTWNNTLSNSNGRYGYEHGYSSLDKKTIKISFVKILPQNEMALWRESLFAAIDCPDGPRRLTFNDQPNRYYNVLIDGEIGYEYDIGTRTGQGTLVFIVPDGLAYATYKKVLTKDTTDSSVGSVTYNIDGSITCTVNNQGNVDAYPIITIKNKSENDYIGIANENGIYELGNKFDPDGISVADNISKTILDIKSNDISDTTGWGQFKPLGNVTSKFAVDFKSNGGSLKYGQNHPLFGSGMVINSFGSTTAGARWIGGFSRYTIPMVSGQPMDTTNFSINAILKIWESRMGQTGIMSIDILDKDGIGMISYLIHKSDIKGDVTNASFRRNIKYPQQVPTDGGAWVNKSFGANNNEKNQVRRNVAFNSSKGQITMSKNMSKISWSYNGVTQTINASELTNAKAKYIDISIGRLVTQGKTGPCNTMVINSMNVTINNTSAYIVAPNLYSVGSVNTIDMNNGNAYYTMDPSSTTKTKQNKDLVDGSEAFPISKGISDIIITPSTWATQSWYDNKPEVSIEWVERFA